MNEDVEEGCGWVGIVCLENGCTSWCRPLKAPMGSCANKSIRLPVAGVQMEGVVDR